MTDVSKLPEDNGQIDYNEYFKSKVGLNTIAGTKQREGWIRKGVITNYPASSGSAKLVRNFENHLNMGWSIIYDVGSIQDDRKFSPNVNNKPNKVPAPIIGRTADGYDYVMMEIEESKCTEYFKEQERKERERYLKSIGGKSTVKRTEDGLSVYIKEENTQF